MPLLALSLSTNTLINTPLYTTMVRNSGSPRKSLLNVTSFAYSHISPTSRPTQSPLLLPSGLTSSTMSGSTLTALFLILTFVPRLAGTPTPLPFLSDIWSPLLLTQLSFFLDSSLPIGLSTLKAYLCL